MFSVAGEEWGFVGAAGVIVLVVFLILRTLLVGSRSDPFGQLVCVGVAVWFAVQAFENIGMNLGIMPVTGLPLPFLSYGGSSMFAAWLALGLVNNVHLAERPSVADPYAVAQRWRPSSGASSTSTSRRYWIVGLEPMLRRHANET